MSWKNRQANIEEFLSPLDTWHTSPAEGRQDALVRRMRVLMSLWMHLRGHSAEEVIHAHNAIGVPNLTTPALHNDWVQIWRSSGLPMEFASLEVGTLFEAASASYVWAGTPQVQVDLLPDGLVELWLRAERCASSTVDFDLNLDSASRSDPELRLLAMTGTFPSRVIQAFTHLAGARLSYLSIPRKPGQNDPQCASDLNDLVRGLLQLEITWVTGERIMEIEFVQTIATAHTVYTLPYSLRSGWAELGEAIPEHLQSRFLNGGHRTFRYGTGDIAAVAIYADSSEEAKRLIRFCREPHSIGFGESDGVLTISLVLPLHSEDGDPTEMPLAFSVQSVSDRTDLVRAITQQGLRLEIYGIENQRTQCLATGFVPLQPAVTAHLMESLAPYTGILSSTEEYRSAQKGSVEADAMSTAMGSEASRFEMLYELSIFPSRSHLDQHQRHTLNAATSAFLTASSASKPDQELVSPARDAFYDALSAGDRPPRPDLQELLEQEALGHRSRWVMYADLRDGALDLTAAGLGPDDVPTYERHAVKLATEDFILIRELGEHLASPDWSIRSEKLQEFGKWWENLGQDFAAHLRSLEVADVVVSPGHGLEALPFHMAASWIDLIGGYIPSVALVQTLTSELLPAGINVHIGTAPDLEMLNHEAAALRSIYKNQSDEPDFLRPDRRRVHFAGHAVRRANLGERALRMRNGTVSVADLLNTADLLGVELTTLSACSTGSFAHNSGAPMELGGVDFALIARGSRSVVSTMWNVRDRASALFMISFHARLASGQSIAQSFTDARDALRLGKPVSVAEQVLDESWPTWRQDTEDGFRSASHWASFRLVGRYWETDPPCGHTAAT